MPRMIYMRHYSKVRQRLPQIGQCQCSGVVERSEQPLPASWWTATCLRPIWEPAAHHNFDKLFCHTRRKFILFINVYLLLWSYFKSYWRCIRSGHFGASLNSSRSRISCLTWQQGFPTEFIYFKNTNQFIMCGYLVFNFYYQHFLSTKEI